MISPDHRCRYLVYEAVMRWHRCLECRAIYTDELLARTARVKEMDVIGNERWQSGYETGRQAGLITLAMLIDTFRGYAYDNERSDVRAVVAWTQAADAVEEARDSFGYPKGPFYDGVALVAARAEGREDVLREIRRRIVYLDQALAADTSGDTTARMATQLALELHGQALRGVLMAYGESEGG